MTATRRDFVIGTGVTLAAVHLGAEAAATDKDKSVEKQLAGFTEELLVEYPESATLLGIDNGARAGLKRKLSDRSAAGQKAIALGVSRRLEQLKSIDTAELGAAARIDVDVMRTAHEFALEGFAFPYGDVALLDSQWSWRNAPYVVAQNTGAFLEIPSMLDEQHTVQTRDDADAYLARLEAYAGQLDGETGRPAERRVAERDRARFPARQDTEPDQARTRRRRRAVVTGHVSRKTRQGHARCGGQCCEDRG
jgi:uncharacterized protein (DUF885 family)